jgi:hypothetical protein
VENLWIEIVKAIGMVVVTWITVHYSNKKSNKGLEGKVDKLVENDKDQYLAILRLTIFEENLPISERIIAGDKYLKKGGNGDTKKYYEQMLAEHTK